MRDMFAQTIRRCAAERRKVLKKFLILTAVLSVLCMTAASFVSCGRDNDGDKTNDSAAQGADNDAISGAHNGVGAGNDSIDRDDTDGIGGAAPGLSPSPSQNS